MSRMHPDPHAPLVTPLWSHQREALDLMRTRPAWYLAWGMGAGKTLPVVAHVVLDGLARTLIVAPKSVVSVWPDQFARHAPGTDVCVIAPETRSVLVRVEAIADALRQHRRTVVALNYEALSAKGRGGDTLRQLLRDVAWDLIVLDEAHRAKAPGGVHSRFLATIGPRAKCRGALSGTPMPHSPLDVYAQFRFLDPSIYGRSYVAFRSRYAVMGGHIVNGRPVEVVGFRDLDDLHRRFARIAHRVRKEDVLDLPATVDSERWCEIGPEARRAYADLERHLVAEIEAGTVTAANAMVRVTRLQQVATGYAAVDREDEQGATVVRTLHLAKAELLADVLADLDPHDPVVVFCRFRWSLEQARAVSAALGRPVHELSGRRNDIGSRWKPEPGAVACVQIQAGGLGVDLTAAATAVYFDLTFSLGDYDQSRARLDRPGQTRKVHYIHLLARDTLDPAILGALRRRRDAIEAILAGLVKEPFHARR